MFLFLENKSLYNEKKGKGTIFLSKSTKLGRELNSKSLIEGEIQCSSKYRISFPS